MRSAVAREMQKSIKGWFGGDAQGQRVVREFGLNGNTIRRYQMEFVQGRLYEPKDRIQAYIETNSEVTDEVECKET
jgi:hypothetical protein